jgi:hypothetical protein
MSGIPGYTPYDLEITMVATDGVTPFGGTVSLLLKKQGGSFYSSSPLNLGNGMYQVPASITDQDTPGTLMWFASGTGATNAWGWFWIGTDPTMPVGQTYYTIPVLMVDDSFNPVTGLLPGITVQIFLPGASSWTSPAGTLLESGNGLYELQPAEADVAAAGSFGLYASSDSAEPQTQALFFSPFGSGSNSDLTESGALTVDPHRVVILS